MIGKIIGNYRLTEELGYGNTGVVYRGQDLRDARDVVIKEISLTQLPTSSRVQLKAHFRRVTFILSQLDHPSIAKIYESFSRDENQYLVLEYVQGTSLRELLRREGVPNPAQAVFLCKQALVALDYAHNFKYMTESDRTLSGIIHRDIRPSNLLVDENGELKITDFGIVRMPERQSMAPPSFRPGTMEYNPPEHLRGLELDARSDIYSLGVTFYEVLTGKLPVLEKQSKLEQQGEYYEPAPMPISELRPEIDPLLASIFMRAIQKTPSDRFQTASEFLEAIEVYERNSYGSESAATINEQAEQAPDVSIIEIAGEKPFSYRTPLAPPPVVTSPMEREAREVGEAREAVAVAGVSFENQSERARGMRKILFVATIVFIIFGVPVGAYFLTQPKSAAEVPARAPAGGGGPAPGSTTAVVPAPTPEPTPAPIVDAASGEVEKLRRARDLESRGMFKLSEKKYEEYLRSDPNESDAAMATSELENLKKFVTYLRTARAAAKRLNFTKARLNYSEALKLRPYSKVVRSELDKAQNKVDGEQGN
ncbi:MAG: serine/threonine protein kinase [Blastocatellia bacterium]|nr:serine/threonine protein kinase [Blastocatellia bacterium]